MNLRLGIAIAVLVLQASAAIAATDKPAPPAAFKVVKAEFGLLTPAGGFQPSTRVPLKEGQGFGWVMQLDTKRATIRWREELKLPAAPQVWQADEKAGKHSLSIDRRTSILEREARIEDGAIYNFWQIAAGDPKGRYTIRVMIEGVLVSTFEFDVE
jgi:hypothetical protein